MSDKKSAKKKQVANKPKSKAKPKANAKPKQSKKPEKKSRRLIFKLVITALLCGFFMLLLLLSCYGWISYSSSKRIYTTINDVPECRVGLVLGCRKGTLYFSKRIKAAVELYRGGKVDYLLVSGDNHVLGYNEPADMRDALVMLGVPANRVVMDFAGFRTLDSVVRAKHVFKLTDMVIISQRFHVERALYLASHNGINAVGYCADDVPQRYGARTMIRELGARVMAIVDLKILGRKPKFLGPEIDIVNAGKIQNL